MRKAAHRNGYSHYLIVFVEYDGNELLVNYGQIFPHELVYLTIRQGREAEYGFIGIVQ